MNNQPCPTRTESPLRVEILAISLLLALVCLLAWPGMNAPRLLDDLDEMGHVKGFLSWKNCFGPDMYGLFRPLKNLIFYGFENLPLFQWHALNLTIYLAAIPVAYLFLRRLLGSAAWAFAAVAVWATCPTQVSTAIWMSCANISLAMSFSCAVLYFHDRSRETSGSHLWLSALAGLCLFLAQCSYEAAVAVPGLCVLIDRLRNRPLFSRAAILRYALLALITLLYLGIRMQIGAVVSFAKTTPGFALGTQSWQLSLSAPWFLWRHFSMWFMPSGRIEFCSTYVWGLSAMPWELAAAWGWLMGMIGVIVFTWKRHPWVAFGLLWFLITSFPSSNFIPIWAGPIADYYLALPSLGLAIALIGCAKPLVAWIKGAGCHPQSQAKLIGTSLICFILLWRALCLPLFWLQAALWCRPLELFLHCELSRPAQYHLQALAARELLLDGHLPEAKEWALKSYEIAPHLGLNSMILGRVAFDTGEYLEAEKRFREAIHNTPENSPIQDYSRFYLAKSYMAQETQQPLVRETLLPLLNNPRSSCHLQAITLQIDCYLAQNKPNDAHRAATKATHLHPDNPELAARLKDIEEKFPATAVTQPAPP